jgi:hypothetical protein
MSQDGRPWRRWLRRQSVASDGRNHALGATPEAVRGATPDPFDACLLLGAHGQSSMHGTSGAGLEWRRRRIFFLASAKRLGRRNWCVNGNPGSSSRSCEAGLSWYCDIARGNGRDDSLSKDRGRPTPCLSTLMDDDRLRLRCRSDRQLSPAQERFVVLTL